MQQVTSLPLVMGILNLTPDSFSDGGRFNSLKQALQQAEFLLSSGADVLDLGGESTRPGAAAVGEQEELARVMPVVEALRREWPELKISIDTTKAAVMQAAIDAGVWMINDVNALRAPGALEALAAAPESVQICLMHMQGEPRTMQQNPQYEDVCAEVKQFLAARVQTCMAQGIAQSRLYLDPGFGFGKSLYHNLLLMQQLQDLHSLGCPLFIGVSRKSMIGAVLERPVDKRLNGGLALALWSALQGAAIIRTHDVAETREVLQMLDAVLHPEQYL